MGMTKASLDFQIQQETQKTIARLANDVRRLDSICQIIDMNVRQSHSALFQDIIQLRIRINFLMDEFKAGKTEEEVKAIEERFLEYAKGEAAKMDKKIADALAAREKAQQEAELKKEVSPDEPESKLIQ